MEYSIAWGGDPEDVCFTTSGVGRLADVHAMYMEALADPRWRPDLKVLFDHTRCDWGAIASEDLTQIPRLIKHLNPEFGQGIMAAAVRDPESYRAIRLIALQIDREVPWLGHVFGSLAEARAWLADPSETVLPHVLPQW